MPKCPGRDQRYWKPDDVFEINCLKCGTLIEFWKDEPTLKCPKCKKLNTNPKLDLSCAKWCKYAKECLGTLASQDSKIPVQHSHRRDEKGATYRKRGERAEKKHPH